MTSTLRDRIQQFYDASSNLWEQVWGEHMHHGYYGATGTERKDRRQAQIDLIDEVLRWANVQQANAILDVGCGIGGSSLELAERYGANVTGITLSPVQANRATERAVDAELQDRVQFQVADALATPFADNQFDVVWSMESGEHMPEKPRFLAECFRVLKPGGIFLMVTWCHRTTDDEPLTLAEKLHLEAIYRVYCLPYVISLPEYEAIAHSVGFDGIHTADWSQAVAPFWNEVADSVITPSAVVGLINSGWTTIQAALSVGLMQQGYQRGLVRFGLLCGRKPE